MVVRWVAAGVLEAVKGFRRLKGHKAMPQLVAALRARDQQLGLVVDVEETRGYLAPRQQQAAQVRHENEQRFAPAGVRDRLLARRG